MQRNEKHINSVRSKDDFKKYVEFTETILATNPSTEYTTSSKCIPNHETSYHILKANTKALFDLEDMVKFSNISNMVNFKPDFFYKEIILNRRQSFKDIQPSTLNKFVE